MNRSIFLAALLGGCVFQSDMTIEHTDLEIGTAIDAIVLDIHAGDVTVVLGDVERAQVNRVLRYAHRAPEVDAYMDGNTLMIEARCPGLGQCSSSHEIILPKSASFEGSTGSGDVSITGMTDDVMVETGSGDVMLEDITGLVSVDTGSGDVLGRNLDALAAWAETGSGDVDFHLISQPNDVFVSTGSGDVLTELPSGTYRVKTSTGSGDVNVNGITTDKTAPDHIEIETGSGNIKIRGI